MLSRNKHVRKKETDIVVDNFSRKAECLSQRVLPSLYFEERSASVGRGIQDRSANARARLYCENLIDRKADNSNLTKLPRNRGTSSLPANHHRRTPLSPSRFRYPLFRRRRLGYVSHPDLFLPSSRAVDVPTTPVPRDLSLSIRPLPPRMFLRSAWQAARERERACERKAHKWKTD